MDWRWSINIWILHLKVGIRVDIRHLPGNSVPSIFLWRSHILHNIELYLYRRFQKRLTAEQCLYHPWMTDNRVSVGWAPDTRHPCSGSLIKFVVEGLCGSSALSTNFLDARYLLTNDLVAWWHDGDLCRYSGEAAVAPLVPRHHCHEQDEAAQQNQLRQQMTKRRAWQVMTAHV